MKAQLATLSVLCCGAVLTSLAHAETEFFSRHKAMDTNGSGHVAFTYLLPKGWSAKDDVIWNIQRRLSPMIYTEDLHSSDSLTEIRYLSGVGFNYAYAGKRGMIGEPPPEKPSDWLIEGFKKIHPNVEFNVLKQEDTPVESPLSSVQGSQAQAFRSVIKLRFVSSGVPMLCKASLHFSGYRQSMGQVAGQEFYNGGWMVQDVAAVCAPEKTFPKAIVQAGVVLSSCRLDSEFYEQYVEICGRIKQQEINETNEMVKESFAKLRALYHTLTPEHRSSFQAAMAAKSKQASDFCDYVSDQERYSDGSTEFVLPSGYNRAAADNAGNYVLTNSASYQPTGSWHELRKVH